MSSGENVKVAVRVRPFNEREKNRKAQLIVSMEGQVTYLADPQEPRKIKRFAYDHSYWSHDGFKINEDGYCEPDTPKYVDQLTIFNELGLSMLDNAWKGYNCSIFAYGQTGSGKSYSIMGHGANKGIVPRTCEELFKGITQNKEEGINYEVSFSMLEIYNEQVRDLLNKKKTPQGGLHIKEKPRVGFYVEGLTVVPVGDYKDIRLRMNEGERQRTIAATKMNETSSRAHTIVTINFAQNNIQRKTTKLSNISLVDLAGSERAKQTEATGDRFEEAKNINLSLMTLGNVIQALCEKAGKGSKNVHVPFRNSVLTKLLKNTLGGNSKTVMIAAIGPDAENYEQTLSTLRYADRAKSIRTDAKVNQEATDKIIKALIDEKERLLRELENAKSAKNMGVNQEEIDRMKEEQEREILQYKEQMRDIESGWKKRLDEARREMEEISEKEKQQEEEEKKMPHLSNLNEDPALTGKLVHLLKPGNSKIGNGKDGTTPEVVLNGPRIAKDHALMTNKKGDVYIKPVDGLVLYNGQELNEEQKLQHQDRIRLGSNNLFIFVHPLEADVLKKKGKLLRDITYEFAQSEIIKHSGLNISDEDTLLQEEVMSLMQLTQDVNAMAEDMEKPAEFAIVLMSPEARGLEGGRTEVYVKVVDLDTNNEYLWDKNKFLNRQVHMQEMYSGFEESGNVPSVPKERDPFWEPTDTDVVVGVVIVPLNYLSHMLEFTDEPLTIIDYRAKQSGFLKVDLVPCDSKGNEDVDLCVDDPMDLVGTDMSFKIKVHQAMNLDDRFDKSWCRYKFYQDYDYTKTDVGSGKNPVFNHDKLFRFKKKEVDHRFVDYLREKSMAIEIWGKQGIQSSASSGQSRREDKQRKLNEWKAKAESLQNKLDRITKITDRMSPTAEVKEIKKILQE